MTQAKSIPHSMDDDDDMLPEYDFSKMGTPVRGKHAQRIRANGYSTTVHHANGTSTTTYVTPEEIALRRGDYVAGDKVMGDSVNGDKIMGNKITHNLQGAQIGNFANELNDHATQTASNFTQTNNANTAELLQLITALRQTTSQFPTAVQEDLIIDIEDIEAEINKPANDRNLPKIKKRLIAIMAVVSLIAAPIAATTDFTNNALEIATKVGIELPKLPSQAPQTPPNPGAKK
jgi:hypothetical protein